MLVNDFRNAPPATSVNDLVRVTIGEALEGREIRRQVLFRGRETCSDRILLLWRGPKSREAHLNDGWIEVGKHLKEMKCNFFQFLHGASFGCQDELSTRI